jgi:sugar phosphate isomerase/epimerase
MQESDIAVNLLVFKDAPLSKALNQVVESGLSIVELAYTSGYAVFDENEAFTTQSAKNIRKRLQERGIVCRSVAAHIDLGSLQAIERFSARLRFASEVGANIVITNTSTKDHRSEFVENLETLSDLARQLGLIIALENPGDGENNIFPNGEAGAAFIQELGNPYIRLNYDYSNALSYSAMELDPHKDCHHAIPYCASLHLKDMKRVVTSTSHRWDFCAIGDGDHDYKVLLSAVKESRKDIPLSLELPLHMYRTPDFLMHRREVIRSDEYNKLAIRQSVRNVMKLWNDV